MSSSLACSALLASSAAICASSGPRQRGSSSQTLASQVGKMIGKAIAKGLRPLVEDHARRTARRRRRWLGLEDKEGGTRGKRSK